MTHLQALAFATAILLGLKGAQLWQNSIAYGNAGQRLNALLLISLGGFVAILATFSAYGVWAGIVALVVAVVGLYEVMPK